MSEATAKKLMQHAKDRLIVALDVPGTSEALNLVSLLRESVGMFKVGSQLFTSAGPDLVRKIVEAGNRVFLDLKFHDIPHQVAAATRAAAELEVTMLTVHAAGGFEMMTRAAEAANEVAARKNKPKTKIIGVTVLTSVDSTVLTQIGMGSNPIDSVTRLASLAASANLDGVVASPQEAAAVRSSITRPGFLIVTPGIRPSTGSDSGQFADDQKRVATPASAVSAGTDYLVVGRPITGAKDVIAAAQVIINQIEEALAS
jgi:orotidine-5'-phosphate decarboxylase